MEIPETKTTRSTKRLTETIQKTKLISSLRAIDMIFTSKMEQEFHQLKIKNIEREKLKSALKFTTEEVNIESNKIAKHLNKAKEVVKLALPQTHWIEFRM